ncbi:SpoVA/SpoVAEb family sporulation membrane protein [Clostridium sp. A1-XYC3]|uniref:SpoVA/SpoVAEb family sporulation membrane protein n=1 Tax=Clostridium tanneri TaxID=3037988 RepID=A0ABU4JWE7_9CLOT|nr:SpoVA/SpoVAEb family sporulation membrane protein [Clostridium sp. A1-XYC3]MDW8802494.1 SpoVA/SpoVAEb family sporulation membrane protein [Clostridium sp. A1-XYC3]
MDDIKIQTTNSSPKEVEARDENSAWFKSCLYAGLIGGLISVFAHILSIIYIAAGVPNDISLVVTLSTLLLLGALTTGLGWYSKLDKYGPAGGMLPTTGLSGAITGSAMQSKKMVNLFLKMFTKDLCQLLQFYFGVGLHV